MTVQIYNAEQFELLRSVFADKGRNNAFAYNIVVPWYDFPLNDATNGNQFNDNDSSFPQGWTAADAAFNTNTSQLYGFWLLEGNTVDLSWKYRIQLDYDVEADTADGDWVSFNFGPVLYRDLQSPSDLSYYFGLYANNAGAINENIFVRTVLNWDSAGGQWRARGEWKDGTTQLDGAWFTLSENPPPSPLYFRSVLRHFASNTNERLRSYAGLNYYGETHTQLLNVFSASANQTWGQCWLQIHQTRNNTGINDYLLIGGIDRTNTP